jgi:hypothetical protein
MVVKEFVMRVSNETLVHTIRKEASYNIYARKQIEKNPAKSPPSTPCIKPDDDTHRCGVLLLAIQIHIPQ